MSSLPSNLKQMRDAYLAYPSDYYYQQITKNAFVFVDVCKFLISIKNYHVIQSFIESYKENTPSLFDGRDAYKNMMMLLDKQYVMSLENMYQENNACCNNVQILIDNYLNESHCYRKKVAYDLCKHNSNAFMLLLKQMLQKFGMEAVIDLIEEDENIYPVDYYGKPAYMHMLRIITPV
jgi:hypothetical protein